MLKGVVLSTISLHYILSKLFSMLKSFESLIAKKYAESGWLVADLEWWFGGKTGGLPYLTKCSYIK